MGNLIGRNSGPDVVVEVFKFGCYVFFPILAMLKFGDPEW